MISYNEALRLVAAEGARHREHLRSERLSLLDCVGRYSAADLDSLDSNPRFDNAAMDGYAVISSETRHATQEAPVRIPVTGCLAAGEAFVRATAGSGSGSCIEIMTGAGIPEGPYDAVVKMEEVEPDMDPAGRVSAITLRSPVQKNENIRRAGEDFRKGDRLLSRGTRFGPQHVLALAMAGHSELDVLVPPRIVVFSTGSELVPFDSPAIAAQQIRNSAAPLLCAALKLYGAETVFHGIVSDRPEGIRQAILQAREARPDLIVTTGGVSVGKYDLVRSALVECGAVLRFHNVAVRPGKPVLFGSFPHGGPAFFGLPGNPMAVAAGVRFFVRPFLSAICGEAPEAPHILPLTAEVRKPSGLSFFLRAVRDGQGVRVLSGQASFMAASFLTAEGWAVGRSEAAVLQPGDLVEWYPLW